MTRTEFNQIIKRLSLKCAVLPTDEQLKARVPDFWEEVEPMTADRFERGVKWLTRQPEFKFFPTLGEMLEAIRRADWEERERAFRGNQTDDEARLINDPAFRAKRRAESEESAKEYFDSPEHADLLKHFRIPEAKQ